MLVVDQPRLEREKDADDEDDEAEDDEDEQLPELVEVLDDDDDEEEPFVIIKEGGVSKKLRCEYYYTIFPAQIPASWGYTIHECTRVSLSCSHNKSKAKPS